MEKFAVLGEDVQDVLEHTEELRIMHETYDKELAGLFLDIIRVRDALQPKSASRKEIQETSELSDESDEYVSAILQTLRGYGVAHTSGKGWGWSYRK